MQPPPTYIPLPPLDETVEQFFSLGLAAPLTMDSDFAITIPYGSPFYDRAVQSAMGTWAETAQVGLNCQRNQFNRWTATIGKPVFNLQGQIIGATPLCSFTHEREGEALFRAVLLYEEKKANGDFLANDNQSKGLLDEHGNPLNKKIQSSMVPQERQEQELQGLDSPAGLNEGETSIGGVERDS